MAAPSPPCTIFYSWQSQLPNSTNRGFIEQALEMAARAVRDDATIDARPDVDKDTVNVPGSPNIADTIRTKIDAAEVAVFDVSIVQGNDGDGDRVRPTPNGNVLIELGYAMKSLGTTDRIVLVMNTAYGGIDKLPFDLRQYRPATYALTEDATNKADVRKRLASSFDATFRDVLKRPSRFARPVPPVELELSYKKDPKSTGGIHYYRFVAQLKNTGAKRLDDWYLEVDFPHLLVPRGAEHGAFVRTDGKTAVFRTSPRMPAILVGDHYDFPIDYTVDHDLHWKHTDDLEKARARARAFVGGEVVATAELKSLQNF